MTMTVKFLTFRIWSHSSGLNWGFFFFSLQICSSARFRVILYRGGMNRIETKGETGKVGVDDDSVNKVLFLLVHQHERAKICWWWMTVWWWSTHFPPRNPSCSLTFKCNVLLLYRMERERRVLFASFTPLKLLSVSKMCSSLISNEEVNIYRFVHQEEMMMCCMTSKSPLNLPTHHPLSCLSYDFSCCFSDGEDGSVWSSDERTPILILRRLRHSWRTPRLIWEEERDANHAPESIWSLFNLKFIVWR